MRFVLACALLAGCGNDGATTSGEPSACAPHEWQRADGTCVPAGLPPDMPCPPGEWLREEDALCIPAGVPPDGCGQGFVHDGDRGCEPILPAEPCADGLMAVPGDRSCREVAPCATGTWGDIPVETTTEYVDASFSGGGSNGSATAPWTSIQAGVDAAQPGAIVAVAGGTYVEDVIVRDQPVRLWGRCPALVELAGTGPAFATLFIQSGASGTEVRGLGISGPTIGVVLSGSQDVLIDEVRIHDNADRGLRVQDDYGSTSFVVRGSLFERNHEMAVFVGGSQGMVQASHVRDTLPNAGGDFGYGAGIDAGPATGTHGGAAITGSLFERNHAAGIFAYGSDCTVETTVVRETMAAGDGFGTGIAVAADVETGVPADATVRTSLVERNRKLGVHVTGAVLTLDATIVRDTMPGGRGLFGRGVNVEDERKVGARGDVTLRYALVERNMEMNVFVGGSNLTMEATALRDALPSTEDFFGRGLHLQGDPETDFASSATLRACHIERSVEAGIAVFGPATADVEACVIRDTATSSEYFLGDGVVAWSWSGPASATVRATLIENTHRAAVSTFGATAALGSSLFVCQGLDLATESWSGQPSVYEDLGGTLCGCPTATEACVARSFALEPPPPIGGLE